MRLTLTPINGADAGLNAELALAGLQVDDLNMPNPRFYRFDHDRRAVGFGGFELYGPDTLLRSVVLAPAHRGKGHGGRLVELLLQEIRAAGARNVYLLTESAAPFFTRLGFQSISREQAPSAIRSTRQAQTLCPASAALMVRYLPGET